MEREFQSERILPFMKSTPYFTERTPEILGIMFYRQEWKPVLS
jgi:hypothetical protein